MTSEIPAGGDSNSIRVGDAERRAVIERLELAHSDGQIDLDELDERSKAAVAARTRGDLTALTSDLPNSSSAGAGALTAASAATPAARPSHSGEAKVAYSMFKNALRGFIFVALICNAVWLATSIGSDEGFDNYWPIWPMLGLGIAVGGTFFNYQRAKDN